MTPMVIRLVIFPFVAVFALLGFIFLTRFIINKICDETDDIGYLSRVWRNAWDEALIKRGFSPMDWEKQEDRHGQ